MSRADCIRELLTNKNPMQIMQVFDTVTKTVLDSFERDRSESRIVLLSQISPTTAEVKRRTELCYDWFLRLRNDCHYSTRKALDYLPRALRSELDGIVFEPPPATNSWGSGVK